MKQYPVDDNRHSSLQPLPAIPGILDAMKRFPLVAFGENHQLQEIHDVLTALLFHPELPDRITDIVMEFGNALYQEIADRFILEGQAIDTAELQQIWRTTLGGSLYWDAPVYEQFFRHVRAINWMLPPAQRLRVLLGDPPLDLAKLHSLTDKNALIETMQRDAHYASVVEREVLQKGRRALLIAGSYHLLRGMHTNHDPHLPNAGTLLATWHPDLLFVIEPLLLSREDSQAKLINLAV